MVGAKINGAIAPIYSTPKNGEIVEIITSSASRGPSRDWLKIVKTGEARNKIRQWFKREQRSENIAVGRAEVERELKKYSRAFTESQLEEIATKVALRIGIKSAEDLYNTIGYGGLSVAKLSGRLRDEFERVTATEDSEPEPITDVSQVVTVEKPHNHSTGGIVIDGAAGCAVKFAKCCNPLPGDSVVGFITKGFGVSIHKARLSECQAGMMKPEDPRPLGQRVVGVDGGRKECRLRGDDTNIRRRRDRADRRDIDRARRYEGLDSTDKLAEMLGRLDYTESDRIL